MYSCALHGQFKVLRASYICSNLSKSSKKSRVGNEGKNRSENARERKSTKQHENARAQKVMLAHRVHKVRGTKCT